MVMVLVAQQQLARGGLVQMTKAMVPAQRPANHRQLSYCYCLSHLASIRWAMLRPL